mgnify:CR=1 FL=1
MTGHPSPLMAVLVAGVAVAFAASPLLVPGFGGFRADQFPVAQVNAPVQPAGYAFAIWGVIYVWLVIGALFGVFARARAVDWQPMRAPLLLSLAVGAASSWGAAAQPARRARASVERRARRMTAWGWCDPRIRPFPRIPTRLPMNGFGF